MSIVDGEAVVNHRADGGTLRDVGEAHILAVPLQFLVEGLQANGHHTHGHHLVERAGLGKIGHAGGTEIRMLLAGAHPVLLVGGLHLAKHVGNLRITAAQQVRTYAVATADESVLGAVENEAATGIVEVHTGGKAFRTIREDAAVGPVHHHLGHRHLGHIVTGGEDEADLLGLGAGLGQEGGGAALNLGGITQLKGCKNGMEDMAGHITQGTGAEVPPATEVPGRVNGMVRAHRGRADKAVPVHRLGDLLSLGGTLQTLGPDGTVRESIHTGDLTDFSVPDPFADLADTFLGGTLVTHLGSHAMLFGQLGEKAGFVHRTGKGLLAIDVLAGSDGLGGDDGVRVIRRSNDHGVGLRKHFLEHHAVVTVLFRGRILLEHVVGILPVHVAQADDFLGLGDLGDDGGATSADTDGQHLQFTVHRRRGNVFGLGQNGFGSHGQADGGGGSGFQERPS